MEDGFEWKWTYTLKDSIILTNNIDIQPQTNFEGSIQLCFRPATMYIKNGTVQPFKVNFETKSYLLSESNTIIFNYTSIRKEQTVSISGNKLKGYDRLPEGADDYVWVRWHLDLNSCDGVRGIYVNDASTYRPINDDFKLYFVSHIPEDAIVLDSNLEVSENTNGEAKTYTYTHGYYYATQSIYRIKTDIIVGYPKEKYQEEQIEYKVDVYGVYWDEEETSLLCSSNKVVNGKDYLIAGFGRLYWHQKKDGWAVSSNKAKLNYSSTQYSSNVDVRYTGKKMDVELADDIMAVSTTNGQYRKLTDEEYYFTGLEWIGDVIVNSNDIVIQSYPMEVWVRYAGEDNFVLFRNDLEANKAYAGNNRIKFSEENKKVVGWKVIIKDLEESIIAGNGYNHINRIKVNISTNNIADTGYVYNFTYLKVLTNGEIQNPATIDSYSSEMIENGIAAYDSETYNEYLNRSVGKAEIIDDIILTAMRTYSTNNGQLSNNVSKEQFEGSFGVSSNFNTSKSTYNDFTGFTYYSLLPNGMNYESLSKMNNLDAIKSLKTKSGITLTKDYILEHITVEAKENWNGTGRTKLAIKYDFSDDPLDFSTFQTTKGNGDESLVDIVFPCIYVNVSVSYDAYFEYGSTYNLDILLSLNDREKDNFFPVHYQSNDISLKESTKTGPNVVYDTLDINENNQNEIMLKHTTKMTTSKLLSSHQDVTTYVQTEENNYTKENATTSNNSTYRYKLRVRTGTTNITNFTIYTNIEEAQYYREHWNGQLTNIDTSYATSSGYNVKIYYSEKKDAGRLSEDNSWKEYTEDIDKTKIKSLAFTYLDENGKNATIPANSLTYVVIEMKSPSNENIATLAYNNCWTEWNAIDATTNQKIDFITGINSNITKVYLPSSKTTTDINISLEKKWEDNNDSLKLRPSTIKYKLISNENYNDYVEITLTKRDTDLNNQNIWKRDIELPKYDEDGKEISYTIIEDTIQLDNNYKYVPSQDEYLITNTLSKELTITKKWLDNNNSYLTRPSNVTIKVLQNDKEYKDVVITGNYSTNEWSNNITVPVYDNEGNEYVYTLKEVEVDNYKSSYNKETYTFTNILSGEEKITITKKWIDNSNQYNTRPSNISIILKQNNQEFKTIVLNGTTDTWKSEEIIVPKYDEKGIKYLYTIEEKTINHYGNVEYDQNEYLITNTLKENSILTITKHWIDGSNAYNTRPENLNITLLQNGIEYKKIILSGNSDIWTTNIEVPKYDDNQVEYKYTIQEQIQNVDNDYTDIVYSQDELSVTNKLSKDTNLTITKKWIDYDNEYLTRPDKIIISLLQNNQKYKELELSGNENIWELVVENVPVYDENGKRYSYTIEESINDVLENYGKITYDQTNLTVTNELTEKPKVTLYFTVKNGYTEIGKDEVKFDEDGYKKVLEKYGLNSEQEYIYSIELENTETGEKYEGNLSTQGVLEFLDLPYGTYRAIRGEDEYFDFVSMLNIEDIPGVTFIEEENGGVIKIEPTGQNIIYGVNIVNKIETPVQNPNTKNGKYNYISIIILIILSSLITYYSYKKLNY